MAPPGVWSSFLHSSPTKRSHVTFCPSCSIGVSGYCTALQEILVALWPARQTSAILSKSPPGLAGSGLPESTQPVHSQPHTHGVVLCDVVGEDKVVIVVDVAGVDMVAGDVVGVVDDEGIIPVVVGEVSLVVDEVVSVVVAGVVGVVVGGVVGVIVGGVVGVVVGDAVGIVVGGVVVVVIVDVVGVVLSGEVDELRHRSWDQQQLTRIS